MVRCAAAGVLQCRERGGGRLWPATRRGGEGGGAADDGHEDERYGVHRDAHAQRDGEHGGDESVGEDGDEGGVGEKEEEAGDGGDGGLVLLGVRGRAADGGQARPFRESA